MGYELLPWQRQVLSVGLEILPNGRLAYRRVVTSVGRQQGKTLLMACVLALRAQDAGQKLAYAAQSGLEGRRKWRDDWIPLLAPLGAAFSLANGQETIRFPSGSNIRLASGALAGMHGAVLDMAILDEAWSYSDDRLEAAMIPAMMTRPNPATWIVSTQGIAGRSLYLDEQCQRGRQAVEADVREGICYFEWSADPSADPADPATWRTCMPALNRTVSEDFVRDAQRSMPPHEFRRAFLNIQSSGVTNAIVAPAEWELLAEPDAQRPEDVVLAVDVSPNSKSAAIAAAGEREGLLYVSVLEHGPGTDWVRSTLDDLVRELAPSETVVDARSAGPLLADFRATRVAETTVNDMSVGCLFFMDLVQNRRLRHRGEPELRIALDGAAKRPLGDGWAWSRQNSGTDITPLVAVTLAAWAWHGGWI
jgi:phage terminase large subunit-like protein